MLGCHLDVDDYLERLKTELDRIDRGQVRRLANLIHRAWSDGRFVFLFGNGGSATTASHLAEDLGKSCAAAAGPDGPRLKVLSLTDNTGWLTALGNDLGYDRVFVEQLAHYGSAGDLAVAISGSGNSHTGRAAVEWANARGLVSFGITGYDGGRLKTLAAEGLHVPLDDMAMVESIHMCAAHWIVDDLSARIGGSGRYGD